MNPTTRDAKINQVFDFENKHVPEEEIYDFLYFCTSKIGLEDDTYVVFDNETLSPRVYSKLPFALIQGTEVIYDTSFQRDGNGGVYIANLMQPFMITFVNVDIKNLLETRDAFIKTLRMGGFSSKIYEPKDSFYRKVPYYRIDIERSAVVSLQHVKQDLRAVVIKIVVYYGLSYTVDEEPFTIEQFRIESDESSEINYVYVPPIEPDEED